MKLKNRNYNLIGQVFGRLTVIEKTELRTDSSIVWKCLCSCGKEHFVNTKHLNRGAIKSCGCLINAKNPRKGKAYEGEDLTDQMFGKLIVIKYAFSKNWQRKWECKCDCGNIVFVTTAGLKGGHHKSCGCVNKNRKGALVYNYNGYEDITGTKWNSIKQSAKTRELNFDITKKDVWNKLIEQENKCALSGIEISFKNKTASVDRKDNNKGYDKSNIQLVHKDINLMRNKFTIEYFKNLCELVIRNSK